MDDLHTKNMHFVPIMDAGIALRPWGDYDAYNKGKELDLFIKLNGEDLVGNVWPNEAVYPDWFHPNASDWWSQSLDSLHSSIKFDGLWLDMNEASDFCSGVCFQNQ